MKFVALDTETGGLDPKVHGITEIGAVAFELDPKNPQAGRSIEEFRALIAPNSGLAYTPYALQLQDNTLAHLTEFGVSEREAWAGFVTFAQKHLGTEWSRHTVAQFAEFDHGFLAALAARCGDAHLLPTNERCAWICTKNIFRTLSGLGIVASQGCGFEDMLRWYGFWYDGKAHTALVDARAVVCVFRHEVSDLKHYYEGGN